MWDLGLGNILTREETSYMRDMAVNRFDKIMQVLKSMLLVFRNINTVRCINITLGAPVDRYFIMAKCAVRGWGRAQADDTRMLSTLSVFHWLCSFWESIKFEFALRSEKALMSVTRFLLKPLSYCGLIIHAGAGRVSVSEVKRCPLSLWSLLRVALRSELELPGTSHTVCVAFL
ncbi:uncharacterized aarF domain-containing protein kinase 5-like isoform X2 [Sinocyclocheilus rhinocerous]|nr:PREDICTED: uncharacterized aarF domain-containing protein kinase 5-like isoform X2 [Sinocyclocheilus rhinocerous]